MKKGFLTTAMLALTLILLGSAHAGEWIENDTYEAPTTEAPRDAILVDGDASEWENFELLTDVKFLTEVGEWVVFQEYNGGVWNGPDDHTSSVAFAWDPNYLYIYTHVVDDEHQNNNSWFDGDASQLIFADGGRTTVTHQYNYALDNAQKNILIGNEKAQAGGLTADDVAIVRDDKEKVTIYEARYSPEILGLNAFKVGLEIGIGICINDGDSDTPGQKGWSGWGPHAAVHGKDAPKTGLVILSGNPPPRAVDVTDKLATSWGEIKK